MPAGARFPHAMLREIFEQPDALRRTLEAYTDGNALREERFAPAAGALARCESLLIAASGSSRLAGLVGKLLLEDFAGIPVEVEYASELIYRSTQAMRSPCFLSLSQSGETADTLEALREAKARSSFTLAITNRDGSSMAALADCSLVTEAGREEAVPATKSFTTQLLLLSLLALFAARVRGRLTAAGVEAQLAQMRSLPELLAAALPVWKTQVAELLESLGEISNSLILGRGIHFPIAGEGALKLKESAYMQADGYPAGELKHGPNALVEERSVVVVLATRDVLSPDSLVRYGKTTRLIEDLKRQGARLVAVGSEGDEELGQWCEHVIHVPACAEHLTPLLEVVPLQLLAYFAAVRRGIDVDRPRNLVKAVLEE